MAESYSDLSPEIQELIRSTQQIFQQIEKNTPASLPANFCGLQCAALLDGYINDGGDLGIVNRDFTLWTADAAW